MCVIRNNQVAAWCPEGRDLLAAYLDSCRDPGHHVEWETLKEAQRRALARYQAHAPAPPAGAGREG